MSESDESRRRFDIESGIPCFVCKERSGLDCANRKQNESTRCRECLDKLLEEEYQKDIDHLIKLRTNGTITEKQFRGFLLELENNR